MVDIQDVLFFSGPTEISDVVITKTKDGVDIEIPYKMQYAFYFSGTVLSKETEPKRIEFTVGVIDKQNRSVEQVFNDFRNEVAPDHANRGEKALFLFATNYEDVTHNQEDGKITIRNVKSVSPMVRQI